MSNTRYILLTSRRRDRTLWPQPAEFEIELSQSGPQISGLTARDPVLNGYPHLSWTGDTVTTTDAFTGGVPAAPGLDATTASNVSGIYNGLILTDTTTGETTRIVGYNGDTAVAALENTFGSAWAVGDGYSLADPSNNPDIWIQGGSDIDEYYTGQYLEDVTLGEISRISSYSGTTKIATLEAAYVGAWNVGDSYQIRGEIPTFQGTLAASTISTATFPVGVGTRDYTGFYVYIVGGDVRRITAYDVTTRVATVGPNFSASPGAVAFEILSFSEDNYQPMVFTGSQLSNQNMACWEITLVSLTLPNATLKTGGRSVVYPYFLVEFANRGDSSSRNRDLLYTNNPKATRAVFQAVTSDTSPVTSTRFIKLDGSGATQTMKFKPNDTLYIRIFTPFGDLFETTTVDNVSPLPPNPLLQITAFFAIRKVS
jgi:hypothetical protein